jgi:hypothetical protein
MSLVVECVGKSESRQNDMAAHGSAPIYALKLLQVKTVILVTI